MTQNRFPQFKELSTFTNVDDLYICAIGFEDRSLGSNKHLLEKQYKAKKTLVVRYDSYVEENEKDKNELENIWRKFSEDVYYVTYPSKDKNKGIENFQDVLTKLGFCKSITINISSFKTHVQLWMLNFALDNAEKIRVVYTEPEGYGDQIESDKAFSSGVKEIFTMPEFSGAFLPGYATLLIIFLGYDFVRTRGTYEQIQPSKKIGIMAEPNTKNLRDHYPKMQSKHKEDFGSRGEILVFSIFDLESVIKNLETIRSQNIETCNISIALNGSKLHTIAALLFAKKFRDMQLVVSTPLTYFPNNYSYGVGRTFELNIDREWIKEFIPKL